MCPCCGSENSTQQGLYANVAQRYRCRERNCQTYYRDTTFATLCFCCSCGRLGSHDGRQFCLELDWEEGWEEDWEDSFCSSQRCASMEGCCRKRGFCNCPPHPPLACPKCSVPGVLYYFRCENPRVWYGARYRCKECGAYGSIQDLGGSIHIVSEYEV